VALWKDPVRGLREIQLDAGAEGILFTACGDRSTRRTADGRWPVDNSTQYFNVAVHQVRPGTVGLGTSVAEFETPAPPVLEAHDLTLLTGWAQAVAEALAYAPECMETLLADAKAGAPWRAALRIAEPSRQLSDALACLGRAVQAVTPAGGTPTVDALLGSCREERPDQQRLERLVRRVVQSTIEQLLTRQAAEAR
jgi:hypothetical protein